MIYLASPYSHQDEYIRESRFRRVCMQAGKMMEAGLVVVSPIAHSHPIELYSDWGRKGLDFWLKQDCAFLMHADLMQILMLDGWEDSKGIKAEINIAHSLGIPIVLIEEGEILNEQEIPDDRLWKQN